MARYWDQQVYIIVELIKCFKQFERVSKVSSASKPITTTVSSTGVKIRKRSFLEKMRSLEFEEALPAPLVRVFLARTLNRVFRHVICVEFSRNLCQ